MSQISKLIRNNIIPMSTRKIMPTHQFLFASKLFAHFIIPRIRYLLDKKKDHVNKVPVRNKIYTRVTRRLRIPNWGIGQHLLVSRVNMSSI